MKRIRVLVVDDSAFARKVMSELLGAEPDLEVVATARDGVDALEKIALHQPDVVTLDLVMPELDGVGVLEALADAPSPRAIVVSRSTAESDIAVRALEAGAVDLVHKPTALATDRLYEIGGELVAKVRAAAGAQTRKMILSEPAPPSHRRVSSAKIVVIGASTGGPAAVTAVLGALPASLPVPVAVVVHMPPSFTASLAARIDGFSPLRVREAADGMPLAPGEAVLAPGGFHLHVDGALRCRVTVEPLAERHRPSVDVLFESAAATLGGDVVAVVMTGMGDDGLRGARAIHERGGAVLTQSAESCVVHGMPRCVLDAGLSSDDRPLSELAAAIVKRL
jgi:two-component system, chemotaxis family, protein-glutamate methylesterase/glutaminase